MSGHGVKSGTDLGAWETIKRGISYTPEILIGIKVTLLLAVLASAGQVVVPIAVQQTIDRGINADGGPDIGFTVAAASLCALAIVVTSLASYLMTRRLFTRSEQALATLRTKAFRHLHELPVLTQNTERRGALVSRVTSDVDQLSQFLVFGGLLFVISIGQIILATIVMAWYSWPLAVLVWVCFAPLFFSIRWFQRKLADAYTTVRQRVATMLSAVAEPVVGAGVVKAYAVEHRTQERIDTAIDQTRQSQTSAQLFTVVSFSLGGISGGLANAGVLLGGIWLAHNADLPGLGGDSMTPGTILAFAFLVSLFVNPVQMGTQILTDAQNAVASWRRVIGVLETPADLVDPGPGGRELASGPISVDFKSVTFAYPDSAPVIRGLTLELRAGRRYAVVGETGSGKSTLAKLLTRLVDPAEGAIELNGIDAREIGQSSFRRSVILVPQEGFLFDDTIAANLAYGDVTASRGQMTAAAAELGLADWLAGLPEGLETQVGQRGESLSAGERQFVALIRAHLAAPDLLVLDEATSAVDPQADMRINAALERLMRNRTAVTIAHRMSTAQAADEVIVVDAGHVVQQGPHRVLVDQPDTIYARLHASWVAQHD